MAMGTGASSNSLGGRRDRNRPGLRLRKTRKGWTRRIELEGLETRTLLSTLPIVSVFPAPIATDGHFYVVSDPGYLSCLETRTGKRVWMEKLGRRHSAAGLFCGGATRSRRGTLWIPSGSNNASAKPS